MKRLSGKNFGVIIWGFALIFTAVLLILNGMNVDLGVELTPWRIVLGVLLLAWIATLCVKLKFTDLFLPLGFLFLVFEGPIANAAGRPDGNLIPTWIVIVSALLLTIGFKAVFSKHGPVHFSASDRKDESESGKSTSAGRIGNSSVYFDAADLNGADVSENLGAVHVYFTNKDAYPGAGMITVHDNLGAVTLHVPREWDVATQQNDNLGRINVPQKEATGGKTLTLVVKDNLGSISVVYE